jgi:hypothetical protein
MTTVGHRTTITSVGSQAATQSPASPRPLFASGLYAAAMPTFAAGAAFTILGLLRNTPRFLIGGGAMAATGLALGGAGYAVELLDPRSRS